MSAFPPIQPPVTQTGNVEIDLDWNGDFQLQANGDLLLALDLQNNATATTQRIQRLLYTNPRMLNANSIGYASAGDDVFHPDYGVGLPSRVGGMFPGGATRTQAQISPFLNKIKSMAMNGLAADPSIAQNPSPTISVNPDAVNISQVDVNIVCYALTGQIITVPSLPLISVGSS